MPSAVTVTPNDGAVPGTDIVQLPAVSLRTTNGRMAKALPAIVRECLVGVRHAVRVFLLLDGVALALGRGDHFGSQLLRHRLLAPIARIQDQPAHRKRRAALRTNLH